MSMRESLKSYYDSKGISPLNFHCRHLVTCNERQLPEFTTGHEAFVGTEYEKGTLPRVLFVSLDPGKVPQDPHERTLEFIRQREESRDVSESPINRHWYQTHALAWKVLQKFQGDLTVERVQPYFAHTNSAKCSENNRQNVEASGVLFEHCREFIPGEVEILSPDILITQGAHSRASIDHRFEQVPLEVQVQDCPAHAASISGKKVIWIHTCHPSARYGLFPIQKGRCWDLWADLIFRFIQDHR